MLRVSIVIPVYNEAGYLAACLDAISCQTVRPYEVIIVDNNSTDGTDVIAKRYAADYSYIRILKEPRQGVVFARDRGFNAAKGDVIGRIDADSVIRRDWVATLERSFTDPSVDAVAGTVRYHDMGLAPVVNLIDICLRYYFWLVLGRHLALQGANMAMRRTVWRDIRTSLCRKSGIHEDFDMAIHAGSRGHNIRFCPGLVAAIGYRQAEAPFWDYCGYVLLAPRTYAVHGIVAHLFIYPVIILAILYFLPIKLLHKGFDRRAGRMRLLKLLSQQAAPRANPALFVE